MYRYRVKLKHKFIVVVHAAETHVAAGTAVVVVVVVASVHATHRRPTETVKKHFNQSTCTVNETKILADGTTKMNNLTSAALRVPCQSPHHHCCCPRPLPSCRLRCFAQGGEPNRGRCEYS